MSGASGSHLALHLMQVLSAYSEVETYLMISEAAKRTWELEMDIPLTEITSLTFSPVMI